MAKVNWADVQPDVIGEIVRQGEVRLAAQVQVALAADQRAVTTASILTAIFTACIGGAIAVLTSASPNHALGLAGLGTGIMFIAAAFEAARAARPVDFHLQGWPPAQWMNEADLRRPLPQSQGEQAEIMQEMIEHNLHVMTGNSGHMAWAMRFALGAPFAGGLISLAVVAAKAVLAPA